MSLWHIFKETAAFLNHLQEYTSLWIDFETIVPLNNCVFNIFNIMEYSVSHRYQLYSNFESSKLYSAYLRLKKEKNSNDRIKGVADSEFEN